MEAIEPKIRPLVDALNETGLVRTFSSCEGHFAPGEQTLVDRNHAYVRFVPAESIAIEQVEKLLADVLIHFKNQHGLIPVNLIGYKLYTPIETTRLTKRSCSNFGPLTASTHPTANALILTGRLSI